MSEYPRVQIRHIARFAYGESLAAEDRRDGVVQVYGSNGPVGTHDVANTHGQTIVVGRKGSFGKVQISPSPVFAIDTTYFVDESTTRAHLPWLAYALSTARLDELSQDVGVPGLSRDAAYSQRLPSPPIEEQRRIADHLDAETARIDALIAKRQRQIEVLGERTESMIAEVTQVGTFLGDGHGRGHLLRRCFREVLYGVGEASRPVGPIGVLGMGNVGRRVLVGEPGGFIDEVDPQLVLRAGDLLFNRTNSLSQVGKVALLRDVDGLMTCASYVVIVRTVPDVSPQYLNYVLNTTEVLRLARSMALPSIGQANLNPSRWSEMRIVLPSLSEQVARAEQLDQLTAHASSMETLLNRQIELLKERRQTLITAMVTGAASPP